MGNRWENSGNNGWLYFLGSKITADGDCSHEIKRRFLLGRTVMTNLDSILKTRDITLPTKVCLAKAIVFPVVMYGCESWTIKKTEHWRIDAFELCCWRRLLRVPWIARRLKFNLFVIYPVKLSPLLSSLSHNSWCTRLLVAPRLSVSVLALCSACGVQVSLPEPSSRLLQWLFLSCLVWSAPTAPSFYVGVIPI